jgi:integrase
VIVPSSGNVCRDVGFSRKESAHLAIRTDLLIQLARSEWKGHVTMPKGGRLRYVPLTRRLTDALREARHLRGPRVLRDGTGKPLTQKVIQVFVRRTARRANVKAGIAHVLFASRDA